MSRGITSVDTVIPSSCVPVQNLPSVGSHMLKKNVFACAAACAQVAEGSTALRREKAAKRSILCSVAL